MSSYGVYKVTDKKCATCSFWSGNRTIDFNANKPKFIKAETGSAKCIAQKGRTPTAGTNCLKWQQWEKLFCSI
jgi:hypothetical protein